MVLVEYFVYCSSLFTSLSLGIAHSRSETNGCPEGSINDPYSRDIETSRLICSENELTVSYTMGILFVNKLTLPCSQVNF